MARKNKRITLYSLIACENPQEAYDLLQSEGYTELPHGDKESLRLALMDFVKQDGDAALQKLAEIHPHKSLFEKGMPTPIKKDEDSDSMKSAEGEGKRFKLDPNTINVMIVMGGAVFTLTSIVLLIRAAK